MTATRKLRILLADDHALLRESLRQLLDEQDDMEVVGEAADGAETIRLCASLEPQIALIDVSMPGADGIEVAHTLARECPQIRVIALTRHKDANFLARMFRAGAAGYVLKQGAASELVRAIRLVAGGGQFIDPHMETASTRRNAPDSIASRRARSALGEVDESLTAPEEQVLRLVAASLSNHEIGARLSLDTATVADLKSIGMRKLRLVTRLDVIRHATDHHWN
jgi:DNA-binding NarL/FixJ family response regulator